MTDFYFKKCQEKYPRMTKETLRRHCKEMKLYLTPYLNEVLYLHYKGFSKIENLEEYTGLRCLWLENNGLNKIENLNEQKDLRSLYLHYNLIKNIENLEDECPLLDTLNLSHNSVTRIQNLSKLTTLHTLNLSHNRLEHYDDVKHLKECKQLSCVDLSHNWLDDPQIIEVFEAMQELKVLYLFGNPVVRNVTAYRKTVIVRCKELTYLDDRPVFPKDRAAAEAWSEGGVEAERAMRQKWADDERAKIDASVQALLRLRDRAMAKREEEKEGKGEEMKETDEAESDDSHTSTKSESCSDKDEVHESLEPQDVFENKFKVESDIYNIEPERNLSSLIPLNVCPVDNGKKLIEEVSDEEALALKSKMLKKRNEYVERKDDQTVKSSESGEISDQQISQKDVMKQEFDKTESEIELYSRSEEETIGEQNKSVEESTRKIFEYKYDDELSTKYSKLLNVSDLYNLETDTESEDETMFGEINMVGSARKFGIFESDTDSTILTRMYKQEGNLESFNIYKEQSEVDKAYEIEDSTKNRNELESEQILDGVKFPWDLDMIDAQEAELKDRINNSTGRLIEEIDDYIKERTTAKLQENDETEVNFSDEVQRKNYDDTAIVEAWATNNNSTITGYNRELNTGCLSNDSQITSQYQLEDTCSHENNDDDTALVEAWATNNNSTITGYNRELNTGCLSNDSQITSQYQLEDTCSHENNDDDTALVEAWATNNNSTITGYNRELNTSRISNTPPITSQCQLQDTCSQENNDDDTAIVEAWTTNSSTITAYSRELNTGTLSNTSHITSQYQLEDTCSHENNEDSEEDCQIEKGAIDDLIQEKETSFFTRDINEEEDMYSTAYNSGSVDYPPLECSIFEPSHVQGMYDSYLAKQRQKEESFSSQIFNFETLHATDDLEIDSGDFNERENSVLSQIYNWEPMSDPNREPNDKTLGDNKRDELQSVLDGLVVQANDLRNQSFENDLDTSGFYDPKDMKNDENMEEAMLSLFDEAKERELVEVELNYLLYEASNMRGSRRQVSNSPINVRDVANQSSQTRNEDLTLGFSNFLVEPTNGSLQEDKKENEDLSLFEAASGSFQEDKKENRDLPLLETASVSFQEDRENRYVSLVEPAIGFVPEDKNLNTLEQAIGSSNENTAKFDVSICDSLQVTQFEKIDIETKKEGSSTRPDNHDTENMGKEYEKKIKCSLELQMISDDLD